ncbi:uncharacterized protein LOC111435081 [Cucurbita moschata]|uniref:Uncharacterized protein LOC111435081 n=1 Tax=Cucurbita moschata TaxID=3662 RepID=A0A6J1EK50_CUCMO|nr:uncharacterized protein LOC111435081 [Cucurbita moschata]
MSSLDIDGILVNTKELDRLRKEQEVVVLEINKMHKKLLATPKVVEKPGDNSLSKLKHLYTQAKQLSEDEVSVSTTLLGQLETLLPAGPPGQPRRRIEKAKRMKADPDNARLSPAMRNLEACANLKDEQVAARVTPDGAEKDEWFIVKVMHFDKETKLFEVLDEEPGDEDEGGGQRKYKLPMSAIIPFPKRNDPSTVPEFLPGRRVLAVYPGTTALYRATVVNGHRKRKTDDYVLEFDDDEEDGSSTLPQRTVPFHKVVALPEGLRQ